MALVIFCVYVLITPVNSSDFEFNLTKDDFEKFLKDTNYKHAVEPTPNLPVRPEVFIYLHSLREVNTKTSTFKARLDVQML